MRVNPGIFKAYDIRGIYPTDLNDDVAYAIGRAFASFLNVETVVVGRDMRLSGPAMFDAVTNGLMAQGANVINIGMVSTDQYYYACATLDLPGIMVTASHNPKEYSGFKMVKKMPQLLSGDAGIQDLRRIVEADNYAAPKGKGRMTEQDLSAGFVEMVLGLIDVPSLAPLKVIADTGNGMVGPILQRVYARLPSIDLTGMYLDPDGNLPNHGLDPLQPENRAELEKRVVAERADVGFAFDGDGDRFFTIDNRGEFVSGDYLTALLGRYLLEKHGPSKIVYDVRASWSVRDLVTASGGVPLMERVGHAFFKERMGKEGAIFGGEVTGHFYFKDFFFADSGIVPSLLILEMLSRGKTTLADLIKPLESKYFISGEINTRVSGDVKTKLQQIIDRFAQGGKLEQLDGVSISFDDWHCNVRASNTEPLLRLNLEAKSKLLMERKRDELLAVIRG
ncbi:MAG: phosphomannomutase/phosphoglucomutase [Planctomycetaceae bacterium]